MIEGLTLTDISIALSIIAVVASGIWFLIARFKSLGARDEKLDALIVSFKNLDDKMDVKFDKVDVKFDKLDAKIDRVQAELKADIDKVQTELKADIDKLDVKIDRVQTELKADIDKLDARIDRVDAKIDRLEAKLDVKIDRVQTGLKKEIYSVKRDLVASLHLDARVETLYQILENDRPLSKEKVTAG
ncbi:MAG: hypothetical protein LBK58_14495 [Prevotellaceae bacterium]|nr:hypothetical protein [Prevotellaceae bacterium]